MIAAAAHAGTQDISEIKKVVREFAEKQTANLPGEVVVEVGAVDPRLTLPSCPKLEAFATEGSRLWGSTTVGVKCDQQWTIYVPVKIRVTAPIVITTHSLVQGAVIGPTDIMLKKVDLAQAASGILTNVGDAVGKTLNASIPAGYPVSANMLRSPIIIRQGQSVKLISRGSGFQVTSEGIAMGSASEGQTVQVRTPSGRVISGTARSGPVVDVTF